MMLSVPETGMAVIIDTNPGTDIHPINKKDVGYRLALVARAKAYGQKIEYSGPLYESMKVEGNTIRLNFKHTDEGLSLKTTKRSQVSRSAVPIKNSYGLKRKSKEQTLLCQAAK